MALVAGTSPLSTNWRLRQVHRRQSRWVNERDDVDDPTADNRARHQAERLTGRRPGEHARLAGDEVAAGDDGGVATPLDGGDDLGPTEPNDVGVRSVGRPREVGVEHLEQPFEVAVAGRRDEGVDDLPLLTAPIGRMRSALDLATRPTDHHFDGVGGILVLGSATDVVEEPLEQLEGATVSQRLRELAELHRDGIISDEEFSAVKAKLLDL